MDDLIELMKQLDLVTHEPTKLSSGIISEYYVNVRRAYGNPRARKLIAQYMWEKIDKNTTCIAGGGYGGVPLATEISSLSNRKLTMIRGEEKGHGLGGLLDGEIPTKNDFVTIVDDVLMSGGSIRHIDDMISTTGAKVIEAFVVVKRGEGEKYEDRAPVRYLLTASALLD